MPISGGEPLVDLYIDWAVAAGIFFVVAFTVYLVGRLFLVPPLVRVIRLRNPNNDTLVDATRSYARLGFFVIGIPIGVTAAGYGNVVASSAVVVAAVTLAIGVAGQEVIGNFVSGVFLVADPDFQVGDYIEWDEDGGIVMGIGYRVTRVRTPAGVNVTVPNTTLATSTIRSPFTRGRYRMSVEIEVWIGDQADAETALERAASQDPRILDEPEPRVHLDRFDGDIAVLAVQFWISDPRPADILDVRTDFGQRAADELEAAGLDVPHRDT